MRAEGMWEKSQMKETNWGWKKYNRWPAYSGQLMFWQLIDCPEKGHSVQTGLPMCEGLLHSFREWVRGIHDLLKNKPSFLFILFVTKGLFCLAFVIHKVQETQDFPGQQFSLLMLCTDTALVMWFKDWGTKVVVHPSETLVPMSKSVCIISHKIWDFVSSATRNSGLANA
jgi:hypothetical protein